MRLKYLVSLGYLLFFAFGWMGCEKMDSNYKQYLNEYDYSGKISNLRCYLGYERIILAWDNPIDQKSKTILIEYEDGKQQKEYDSLVDSVSIDGLTSGSGYSFTVYTLDNVGNRSVPVSITALPVSKAFVESLDAPTCNLVQTKEGLYAIRWSNLSSILMRFAGTIKYEIKGADGFVKSGVEEVEIYDTDKEGNKTLKEVSDFTLPIEGLQKGVEYTVNFTVPVWPISGKIVTVDTIELSQEVKVKINK